MEWVLRLRDAAIPALRKATSVTAPDPGGITVVGAFNVDRATNTQRVRVALSGENTEALAAETYRHALKSTDPGSRTVLSYGQFVLLSAAAV